MIYFYNNRKFLCLLGLGVVGIFYNFKNWNENNF